MFSCVIIGEQWLVAECGEILLRRGHRIEQVLSSNPRLQEWARSHDLPVRDWAGKAGNPLPDTGFDWLFSISNLRIIPDDMVARARQGAINFHDGPLPWLAGLNTPSWAILEGREDHGVTWHRIAGGIDEGGICARAVFPIQPDDTAFTLNSRCFEAGIRSFAEVVDGIESGTLADTPQDFSERHYYARDRRPDAAGILDFGKPSEELDRLVRALDFGVGYRNPLVTPKIVTPGGTYRVVRLECGEPTVLPPGSVASVTGARLTVAAADHLVTLELAGLGGKLPADLTAVVKAGDRLPVLSEAERSRITALIADAVAEEGRFRRKLLDARDLTLADFREAGERRAVRTLPLRFAERGSASARAGAVAALLFRLSGEGDFSLAYSDPALDAVASGSAGTLSSELPLRMVLTAETAVSALASSLQGHLADLGRGKSYPVDLPLRLPELSEKASTSTLSVGLRVGQARSEEALPVGRILEFVLLPQEGGGDHLVYDATRLSDESAQAYVDALAALSASLLAKDQPLGDLRLMTEDDERRLLIEWNASARDYDTAACVHHLFERQVRRTPDAVAVAMGSDSLTYAALDARAEEIAEALVDLGAGPDAIVGLYLSRSPDMVAAMLAIHKAGAAYLPLDPNFPVDRLAYMLEDSGARIVVTDLDHRRALAAKDVTALCVDSLPPRSEAVRAVRPAATAVNLAYVIYTSGSTGRPKGVMVEHRNAVNFFAGMDDRIAVPEDRQPVWLAVTSLSFDISVLELLWTLTRGFKVVIFESEASRLVAEGEMSRSRAAAREMDFGLFFWGADDAKSDDKYSLLLKSAQFADTHGFDSIWVPERHFHAFGGPYPNPAVAAAALAVTTRTLKIRAGSCVLPLHHPARVAEEWAMIDNLSAGRVAIAFASGWMPEDFILRPENAVPRNKQAMLRDIDVVKRLWRGEAVEFDLSPDKKVAVTTQPRPVQAELPIWLTTAGNIETYREAGRLGANILTHLLGQSIAELSDKIKAYRESLAAHGFDPKAHTVTLMLHTHLGEDREVVKAQARGPMTSYLRSATALIKNYAWAFPAFKRPEGVAEPSGLELQSLSEADLEAILEFAFLRYFEDSGLFGTVDDGLRRIEQVSEAGVDDVACLVDFGLANATVETGLVHLADLIQRQARAASRAHQPSQRQGFADAVRAHGVTHLQCTPSMARMFLLDADNRAALSSIEHLFIGGEAFPAALVEELKAATSAHILNMYGPTETTIWSATAVAESTGSVVPLGRPIANTQLYVLDADERPVPPLQPGELCIGGDGVTRGYLNRPELTAERFRTNPFAPGRYYRTGDLVRFDREGTLHFLGRIDHQVKIRGYRIELGEIEAALSSQDGVAEAVVMLREDRAGDARLVAYLRASGGKADEAAIDAALRESLPDYMVPAHYVWLEAFPLTPNAKVDRKALPAVKAAAAPAPAAYTPPGTIMEREIAEVFRRVLGLEQISISDNFFALGGHSLLAVRAHGELKARIAPDSTITDLFQYPSVAALAGHWSQRDGLQQQLSSVSDRASRRRAMLEGRRGGRLDG